MREPSESRFELYDSEFYAQHEPGARRSARRILPMLQAAYPITSVVDIGCGHGGWLAEAERVGLVDGLGIDGPWSENCHFAPATLPRLFMDLNCPIKLPRSFDAAICLEVAEHLPREREEGLVTDLARMADVVLFSAAIPGQEGDGHVNERWQSHWVELFAQFGFEAHDFIRPNVWRDEAVEWWYRQNILVFSPQGPDWGRLRAAGVEMSSMGALDIVHPLLYSRRHHARYAPTGASALPPP